MRKIFLPLIVLLFLSAPAWSITGISIGAHVGQVTGFSYGALTDSIAKMASEYGWLKNKPNKSMMLIGGHANMSFAKIIDVAGFADYAWKTTSLDSRVDLKLSDFSFGLTATKKFGVPIANPYIGAGLAWHRFVYSLETSSAGIIVVLPDNQTKLGYHVVGGLQLDIPMFPLAPYAEYRYNWINSEKKMTTFSILMVGLSLRF
jgi:hypothetical protein